ncbi:MAG TPA: tetratricopeptide repeat protein [Woeseiaceae bacterium]|nr:tetratricopeptide repeat protein [Woeseiaceae bacterium]
MDDLLSEKEQLEQMRAWWSEYGAYVIGGLVIGIGLMIGYVKYNDWQLQSQLEASAAYETLLKQVSAGNLDDAEATATEIQTSYARTTYAGQAGLAMARLYMDKNRDQDAADALLAVVNGDADDELKHVARLRLARIYLYQDKAQDVVDLLASEDLPSFSAAYGEVLGDAYTALGRLAEAQDAYQKVLVDPLSQGTVDQQLVQWKALDLPEIEADAGDRAEPKQAEPVETPVPETGGSE